ncbi:MAG: zeta toxin family protein [Alphaproteobacteria bacterium]|nr:zeta toxin family protein [Alphaproteobacteria bacterium]
MTEYFDRFVSDYTKRFGNVVNTDNVKLMFCVKGYDPASEESVRAFHPEAARLTGKVFDYMIEKCKEGDKVMFMGGGNGSGKSTVAVSLDKYACVMDSTMAGYESSRNGIQKALDKKLDVTVVYVYRDPLDAWANGVLQRVENGGHITPAGVFANAHVSAKVNFMKLAEEYKCKINIEIYESRFNEPTVQLNIEGLKNKHVYSKEEILEGINDYSKRFERCKGIREHSNACIEQSINEIETQRNGYRNKELPGSEKTEGTGARISGRHAGTERSAITDIEEPPHSLAGQESFPVRVSFVPLSDAQKKQIRELVILGKLEAIPHNKLQQLTIEDGEKLLARFDKFECDVIKSDVKRIEGLER